VSRARSPWQLRKSVGD